MQEAMPSVTAAPVTYHVCPQARGTRLLEVSCRVREPDPAGQKLSLPAWIRGSYLVREFARNVVGRTTRAPEGPHSVITAMSWV